MAKKKVLIIDDEEDFTKLVKSNLEATGRYEVFTENNSLKGISAAKLYRPILIFMDLLMPDIDGSELASRIKRDPLVQNIPIVFVTAVATKTEAVSEETLIGGHPFLAKPVSTQELINYIEKYGLKS